ncbi:hypothetical protein ACFL21_02130 [Patescibacteria group bacterium]
MTRSQCISVTELRTETKKCLENLNEEPKYVFINNKPIAVIMHIVDYEEHFAKPELKQLKKSQVSKTLKKEALKAKKTKKEDLINI